MKRHLIALGAVLLTASQVGAQSLDGTWRIEGRRSGGVVTLQQTSSGSYTYERRSRRTLSEPVRVERGQARRVGSWLVTRAESSQVGLTRRLLGPGGSGESAWRGLYALRSGAMPGVRVRGRARAAERLVRLRPGERPGNRLRLYLDAGAFKELRQRLSAARRSIDLQAYNWVDDDTGRSIARILMARARAGVRVRCLIDYESRYISKALKAKDVTKGLDDEMRRAGVEVIVQNKLGRALLDTGRLALRGIRNAFRRLLGRPKLPRNGLRRAGNNDHCKLLVIDGRLAYVGGQNLANANEHTWRGLQVRIEGPAAHEVLRLFVRHWNRAGGKATLPAAPQALPGDVPAEVLTRVPGYPDGIQARHLQEIARARREIVIGTPQFCDEKIQRALVRAAARGVRVKVIVPVYDTDPQWLTREVLATRQNELLAAGIELYAYQPRPYDIKAAVFDGKVSIMGSAPLNGKRMDEVMLAVPDARFARRLLETVLRPDLRNSVRLKPIRRSLWRKLKGRVFRLVNSTM